MNKEELKKAQAAKKQIVEGQIVLWNARLEALIETGDVRAVITQLASPVEDNIDNCGCNVQCGASSVLTNPGRFG